MALGTTERAIQIFRERGGLLRMSDALKLGIHRRTLYRMRDEGLVEAVSRGLYRLADLPDLSSPDLVTVAARAPRAVVWQPCKGWKQGL